MTRRLLLIGLAVLGVFSLLLSVNKLVSAATPTNDTGFAIQVTPSPLVATVKPGQKTELELKIRNTGTSAETLKIEPRSFKFDSKTGQVKLDDTEPAEVSSWISFSQPNPTIQPGQWLNEKINIDMPKDAGFSYSFALVISRQKDRKPTEGGRLIKGSVAVFSLINVDRPGAVRKLEVGQFEISKKFYEYLPAKLDIRFKNTGNTIVQPYGNVFIQRGKDAKKPIASLSVNESKGYILPGTERTLSTQWTDGFPVYKTYTADDGSAKQKLVWDWSKSKFSNIRIGKYTAKLVAVYNDGQRDIPIEGEITFWVIPWKSILLLISVLVGLFFVQRWWFKRKTAKAVKKALQASKDKDKDKKDA